MKISVRSILREPDLIPDQKYIKERNDRFAAVKAAGGKIHKATRGFSHFTACKAKYANGEKITRANKWSEVTCPDCLKAKWEMGDNYFFSKNSDRDLEVEETFAQDESNIINRITMRRG